MTRSTGKREVQRRREELFSAELKLRSVKLHLADKLAMADRYRAFTDMRGYCAALGLVSQALVAVLVEVEPFG